MSDDAQNDRTDPALPFTGERFTPECSGEIWHEHWHRYLIAERLCRDKRVLDAACGEGYGSAFLAASAQSVIGADIDVDAIAHARSRYSGTTNLRFIQASACELPVASYTVDVVVSFETIEHLLEQKEMLAEFARVLTPEGLLVLSSPNRPIYSDAQNYRNPFHVRELDRKELETLLAPEFPASRWYGQRLNFQSTIWNADGVAGTAELLGLLRDHGIPEKADLDAMYYIVFAARKAASLPEVPAISALIDNEQALYRQFREYYVMAMHQRAEIAALQQQLAERGAAVASEPRADAWSDKEIELDALRQALKTSQDRLSFRETWMGWVRFPFSRLKRMLGLSSGAR